MKYALAIIIGRFQPFHAGHLAMLEQALMEADQVMVVLGSAYRARNSKNPWTWQERRTMVLNAVEASEHARIHFAPLRDRYDTELWAADVVAAAQGYAPAAEPDNICIVGYFKDHSSDYLNAFPHWPLVKMPSFKADGVTLNATAIRAALFHDILTKDDSLAAMRTVLAPANGAFLQEWKGRAEAKNLAEEWQLLQDYQKIWAPIPYPTVFVTVDTLIRCQDQVLLIQRGGQPGKGLWALPGGYVEVFESTWTAALRELQEETTLSLSVAEARQHLKAKAVFDHPERSVRGRVISHAFYFDLGKMPLPTVTASDDAKLAKWVPIAELAQYEEQMHDDHYHMLQSLLAR